MTRSELLGFLIVVGAGLCVGLSPWPLKRMESFKYEQWAFVAMLIGLIALPWAVTLSTCPDVLSAYRSVGFGVLSKAALFSACWGIANILYLICLVRIGVSLTGGIVTGVTVSLGVVMPMIFKGTGIFQSAPALATRAGIFVLAGVAVMLIGVVVASVAGLERERALKARSSEEGGFRTGLLMAIAAGLLGSGLSFAFIYSQGPILEAVKSRGAGDLPANISVWAAALLGGALANVLYPAYLMTTRKTWGVLWSNPREILLAAAFGTAFVTGFTLMGKGMLLLGALGASVGFGLQQNVQMLSGQALGFATGEWQGATGGSRRKMRWAIVLLVVAVGILSYGNGLVGK